MGPGERTEEALRRVLFVCVGNTCRSQMAEAWATQLGEGLLTACSAGTHPTGFVDATVVSVMREAGIDISAQWSKGLDEVDLPSADIVITLGCCRADSLCPVSFAGVTADWPIPDPHRRPLEEYRSARDDIGRRVRELVARLRRDSGDAQASGDPSPNR